MKLLLDPWGPAVLIIKSSSKIAEKPNHRRKRLLERVETEATNFRIRVQILSENRVENDGKRLTKYENARRVAEHFPVLTRELPPKRRAWESEHYRMSIFAAASFAQAYLHNAPERRRSPTGETPAQTDVRSRS